ncbi:MAG: ABC transporter ATP-binding protein [Candidatus Omnitrophica bacterium]|jgi:ABC-type multidrug transport system, ATPase component|nr:ABC transporter ATP-binding protein [Candidatus Omnitrophota bacterium]
MSTPNQKAVEVEKLEKRFGAFTAVNKVSFSVERGEIFGFLGPNGAGKSTTIRMLCGILLPTSGTGHVGGCDIVTQQDCIKQNIGYMSQRFSLYNDLSVEENIDFYAGIYGIPKDQKKKRKEKVLALAGLEEFRKAMTATLSGGWKQRLALGCAIIHEPGVVFLDEPTSGVDPISRQKFWAVIKDMAKNGVTIFVTTHYMDEAENCDRLSLIYKGDIIASGTPRQLKTATMRNEVVQITLPQPEQWLEKLNGTAKLKESALFGAAIHAITPQAAVSIPLLKDFFRKAGVREYTVRQIPPSLEDVFVSLIEEHDKKGISDEVYAR